MRPRPDEDRVLAVYERFQARLEELDEPDTAEQWAEHDQLHLWLGELDGLQEGYLAYEDLRGELRAILEDA